MSEAPTFHSLNAPSCHRHSDEALSTHRTVDDDTANSASRFSNPFTQQLRQQALSGDPDAQDQLGDCYKYGLGMERDYEKAVEWYKKAADQGNAAAQRSLGYCYNYGHGVAQDLEKAV